MPPRLNPVDEEKLRRLRASLYQWALGDIKRSAAVELPRLAFVVIGAWLDAAGRIYTGGEDDNTDSRMRRFMQQYMQPYASKSWEIDDGLRSALLHEYATRHVLLTHADENAGHHLQVRNGLLVLHLGSMSRDCERAYHKLEREIRTKPALRRKALDAAAILLAPVEQPADPVERQRYGWRSVDAASANTLSRATLRRTDIPS